jgi:hypothetical protein
MADIRDIPLPEFTPDTASSNAQGGMLPLFGHLEEAFNLPRGYLAQTAAHESRFDPNASAAPLSSALGLFQFIKGTGQQFGLVGPGSTDLRTDPVASSVAAANLASRNADTFRSSLGREPTATELYLMHQQGNDALDIFRANPNARLSSVLDATQIRNGGGTPNMTVGDFLDKFGQKFADPFLTGEAAKPSSAGPFEQGTFDPSTALMGNAPNLVGADAFNPGVVPQAEQKSLPERLADALFGGREENRPVNLPASTDILPPQRFEQGLDTPRESGPGFDRTDFTGERAPLGRVTGQNLDTPALPSPNYPPGISAFPFEQTPETNVGQGVATGPLPPERPPEFRSPVGGMDPNLNGGPTVVPPATNSPQPPEHDNLTGPLRDSPIPPEYQNLTGPLTNSPFPQEYQNGGNYQPPLPQFPFTPELNIGQGGGDQFQPPLVPSIDPNSLGGPTQPPPPPPGATAFSGQNVSGNVPSQNVGQAFPFQSDPFAGRDVANGLGTVDPRSLAIALQAIQRPVSGMDPSANGGPTFLSAGTDPNDLGGHTGPTSPGVDPSSLGGPTRPPPGPFDFAAPQAPSSGAFSLAGQFAPPGFQPQAPFNQTPEMQIGQGVPQTSDPNLAPPALPGPMTGLQAPFQGSGVSVQPDDLNRLSALPSTTPAVSSGVPEEYPPFTLPQSPINDPLTRLNVSGGVGPGGFSQFAPPPSPTFSPEPMIGQGSPPSLQQPQTPTFETSLGQSAPPSFAPPPAFTPEMNLGQSAPPSFQPPPGPLDSSIWSQQSPTPSLDPIIGRVLNGAFDMFGGNGNGATPQRSEPMQAPVIPDPSQLPPISSAASTVDSTNGATSFLNPNRPADQWSANDWLQTFFPNQPQAPQAPPVHDDFPSQPNPFTPPSFPNLPPPPAVQPEQRMTLAIADALSQPVLRGKLHAF